jgi:hypothetical protein
VLVSFLAVGFQDSWSTEFFHVTTSRWRLFVINSIKDIWNVEGVGRHHIIVVAG